MLEAIESLKNIHLAQMNKIENAMDSKEVQNPTPIGKMECDCASIIYENDQQLQYLLGAQLHDKLDIAHENWHKDYFKIYEIFFKEKKKKGFFSKFVSQKIDPMVLDKAKLYYSELELSTKEFLNVAEVVKRRLNALPESKFKS
jgi:hypothetical protein